MPFGLGERYRQNGGWTPFGPTAYHQGRRHTDHYQNHIPKQRRLSMDDRLRQRGIQGWINGVQAPPAPQPRPSMYDRRQEGIPRWMEGVQAAHAPQPRRYSAGGGGGGGNRRYSQPRQQYGGGLGGYEQGPARYNPNRLGGGQPYIRQAARFDALVRDRGYGQPPNAVYTQMHGGRSGRNSPSSLHQGWNPLAPNGGYGGWV